MPQDKTEIENSKIASDASFSRESNLKTFCFYLSKLNFDIEKHIGKSLAMCFWHLSIQNKFDQKVSRSLCNSTFVC